MVSAFPRPGWSVPERYRSALTKAKADHACREWKRGDRPWVDYRFLLNEGEGGSPYVIIPPTHVRDNPRLRGCVDAQPAIAEVKQAWIEEATRVGLIEGAQDTVGLQSGAVCLGHLPGRPQGHAAPRTRESRKL
jgi:hypothetical protein